MRGFLMFVVVVVLLLAAAVGAMWFVPDIRPEFVKPWFRTATGFTPAKTPEEALDKFKRALAARDYETAALYCSGEYKDVLLKNKEEARVLGVAIDELRDMMKKQGVKSDKSQFVLVMLDPFPASFKIENVKKSGEDKATARLDWSEELKTLGQTPSAWKINNLAYNALLPRVILGESLDVSLERGGDGSWTIQVPVSIKDRHLRDSTEYLRKNASNFRNALNGLKDDVKNSPPTKETFEKLLQTKLEESQ